MIWSWIALAVVLLFGFVVFFGAPYVPTRKRDLVVAFDELYSLGPDDLLVDIGSGDGKVCRYAASKGARAVGYELNPVLVLISKLLSRGNKRTNFYTANLWRQMVPDATTIVYTFGDSRDIDKMAAWTEQQATRLDKTLYFMSYAFVLEGRKPLRKHGAHTLYQIDPLQPVDSDV